MITKTGKVIFQGNEASISEFTFKADDIENFSAKEDVGRWLFWNFQDEFKEMGLVVNLVIDEI